MLTRGIAHMAKPEQREAYEALNPPNGWGNHAGALEFLRSIATICRLHPDCTVRIS